MDMQQEGIPVGKWAEFLGPGPSAPRWPRRPCTPWWPCRPVAVITRQTDEVPARRSAGILLYRRVAPVAPVAPDAPQAAVQVLLGHMGGPFWARKDEAAWSIPKGEYDEGEPPFDAALREFQEELGSPPPDIPYIDLGSIRQSGGKSVAVWAGEADFDAAGATSGTFELEWPPRSGRLQRFPEIDRAQWFDIDAAGTKVVKAQRVFLDRLAAAIAGSLAGAFRPGDSIPRRAADRTAPDPRDRG